MWRCPLHSEKQVPVSCNSHRNEVMMSDGPLWVLEAQIAHPGVLLWLTSWVTVLCHLEQQ